MAYRTNEINEINKNTVAFLTLGCKVNSYETDGMEQLFKDAGYEVVGFGGKARVSVINTCTVTNIADRKSRQMLHKAKKNNPDGIVVAVGCYAQASKEALEIDDAIDIVVGNNQKKNIVHIVENYLLDSSVNEAVININSEQEYEELKIESIGDKTRAYIKIQDGCNQFCSYCIIPYARGRVRSRDSKDVIEEVTRIALKGYKEVVLTGIHISSYGIDLRKKRLQDQDSTTDSKNNLESVDYQGDSKEYHNIELLSLIQDISRVEGIERIRLGSLEPRIITDEFARELSADSKFCPHFHLSLQSGSDNTLKRMNRRYSASEYYEKCQLLRKYFDNPAITTDVIVGFPGETEEDFVESKKFLEKVRFAQMHIFKYSQRKGTKAESMPNQVEESIKQVRSGTLLELDTKLSHEYKEKFMDKIEKVLIEEETHINGKKYQVGHNERYIKIAIESEKDLTNQVVQGQITGYLSDQILFCKIID